MHRPLPVRVLRVERRGNDAESVEAYRAIGDRQRHITRFAFSLLTHYRGQAGRRLHHVVVCGLRTVGPLLREADHAGDELRVQFGQARVSEAEPRHRRGSDVGGKHVRRLREFEQQLCAASRLQVDDDAALVAVEAKKQRPQTILAVRPECPGRASTRRLDLDDIGAEVAQDSGVAERSTAEGMPEIEYLDA